MIAKPLGYGMVKKLNHSVYFALNEDLNSAYKANGRNENSNAICL
jgi:hypothetical protein